MAPPSSMKSTVCLSNLFMLLFLLCLVLNERSMVEAGVTRFFVHPTAQKGNFSTVQSAIDAVPMDNAHWVVIHIKEGTYREKVTIPYQKPYIILKGKGKRSTQIVWDDHSTLEESPTFSSFADNTVVKSLSFRNSYNNPNNGNPVVPAAAAFIGGDKSYFYRVGFYGWQDTLWDSWGRHYFRKCTIQGAVDFIFGGGQSIYENCVISVLGNRLIAGFITAQGRSSPDENSGFVFKNCDVIGPGMAKLGRPWRDFARVLFYQCKFTDAVDPSGWDAWNSAGKEYQLTFAEHGCYGPGANSTGRVSWESKLSPAVLHQLTSMNFIKSSEWLYTDPYQKL